MVKCSLCGDYYSDHRAEAEFELFSHGFKYDYFRKRQICADCALSVIRKLREKTTFEVCEDCGKRFNYAKHEKWFEAREKMHSYWHYCGDKIRCYPCMVKWFRTDLDDENAVPDILKAKVRKRPSGSRRTPAKRVSSAYHPKKAPVINLCELYPSSPVKAAGRQSASRRGTERESAPFPFPLLTQRIYQ